MTTLKQGNLIKDCEGDTCKILGVCGDVVFMSWIDNHGRFSRTGTEVDLKENGFTWDTPAWEPERGVKYWFAKDNSTADWAYWDNDEEDQGRRDFLGIHQTRELCEASILEIRRKLGK